MDAASGEALAEAKADGALEQVFELQDRIVTQFAETLGTARAGGSDHAGLFNWWRFWHHRIGKCPQTDCVAKLQ